MRTNKERYEQPQSRLPAHDPIAAVQYSTYGTQEQRCGNACFSRAQVAALARSGFPALSRHIPNRLRPIEATKPGESDIKMGQQRWSDHPTAIRAIALLGVPPLLYVTGRLALHFVPSFGIAPCEDPDGLAYTALVVEAILIAAGVWLQVRVFRRPSLTVLIAALLAPLAVWLLQNAASDRDALRQQQCASRPLAEAMRACGANPAYYRREKNRHQHDMLTLTAPGTTDRAWRCLSRWSDHNGTVSIEIDESVYREYREAYSKRD